MDQKQWAKMTDKERWEWVKNNQNQNIIVKLDNDQTFVIFDTGGEEWGDTFDFDDYLGWSDGVVALLEVIGIRCECV